MGLNSLPLPLAVRGVVPHHGSVLLRKGVCKDRRSFVYVLTRWPFRGVLTCSLSVMPGRSH